jgi:protein-L-isoaspartate(D-aspartate) O-methyltransferase
MPEFNLEQARFNMVEQQIRPWEVLDQAVLDLLTAVPREQFVPEGFRNLAFADINIPLGHGEVMMMPKVEARMLQSLNIRPSDKVLEIGTGSGYVTALLARMASQVTSVEIHPEFSTQAQAKLARLSITNVEFAVGDGIRGWEQHAPYDIIAVTGSVPLLETYFQQQLTIGGRLFVIVGQSPAMEARLIRCVANNEWATESLFETDLPALIGAPQPQRFVF